MLPGGITAPAPHAALAAQIAERGALVCPSWPDLAPDAATLYQQSVMTCGLAATTYITDGISGGRAQFCTRMSLNTGKHVFVPAHLHRDLPWVARAGFRGGMTSITGTADLTAQVLHLLHLSAITVF